MFGRNRREGVAKSVISVFCRDVFQNVHIRIAYCRVIVDVLKNVPTARPGFCNTLMPGVIPINS